VGSWSYPKPKAQSPKPIYDVRASMTRRILTGAATSVLGLLLLVYLVRQVGLAEIAGGARAVGWGFLVLVALGGLRFAARALAWQRSLDDPSRVRWRDVFAATLAGDALGNVTPLSVLVSEPAKAAYLRPVLPLGPGIAALAVENFLYSLSAAVVVALGMLALLFTFAVPEPIRTIAVVSLGSMIGLLVAAFWMVGRRLAVLSPIVRTLFGSGARASRWLERIQSLEAKTYAAYERRRGRLLPVILCEVSFHVLGVAEIYVTLWLMTGRAPGVLTAFLLESVNRVITIVFKVVPLRVGVDEAGTALFTNVLGQGTATGVTLALVRKARVLVWVIVGLLLLVRRGLGVREIMKDEKSRIGN
jgi:hypothetical protein